MKNVIGVSLKKKKLIIKRNTADNSSSQLKTNMS